MERPLVSVLVLTKNSRASIKRCLTALSRQDYPNLEIVIQDGLSTDGSLEIIRDMGLPNVRLESCADEFGASHGFYKGLTRCRGDIITLCWSDEEIFPHTVSWGVEQLQKRPGVAGIYGGILTSDINGRVSPYNNVDIKMLAWDLEKALCWELLPNYVSSFMWRAKLEESGFFKRVASYFDEKAAPHGCIMYEYFCMPGLRWPIEAVPHFMGKFASHRQQLCSQPHILRQLLEELQASFAFLKAQDDAPDWIKALEGRALAGFHLMMIPNLLLFKYYDEAMGMFQKALTFDYRLDFFRGIARHAVVYLHGEWEFERAKEYLALCLKHDPDFFEWRHLNGYACMSLGQNAEAILMFRRSVAMNSLDKRSYHYAISLELDDHFRDEAARAALAELCGVDPANAKRLDFVIERTMKLLTRSKSLSRKAKTFVEYNIFKAERVLSYLVRAVAPDKPELLESCIAARYFALAYFEELSEQDDQADVASQTC